MKKYRIVTALKNTVPIELLLLADPSIEHINSYSANSLFRILYLKETIIGAYVLTPLTNNQSELKNIAIAEKFQNQGFGTILLEDAIEFAFKLKTKTLIVKTGSLGHQKMFYQKHGFQIIDQLVNYFIKNYEQPIFENGIQHKDMIVLSLDLIRKAY